MTTQPDSPVTDRMGIDDDAMDAAQDPDLVIVAGEVVEEDDAEPDAAETDTDGENDLTPGDEYATTDTPDLVGAETAGTTALTGTLPDAYPADGQQNETDLSDGGSLDGGSLDGGSLDGGSLGDSAAPADLGQQWHDIQAMFVDDPRGSVDLAAAAADAAVSALVQTLQQRQSALAPAGSTSADPGGTEQLREALRSYRIFCQSLTEIGQRLAQPVAMTR